MCGKNVLVGKWQYVRLVAIDSLLSHDVLEVQCCCVVVWVNHRWAFLPVNLRMKTQYEFSESLMCCQTDADSEMHLQRVRNYCQEMMGNRKTNHPEHRTLYNNRNIKGRKILIFLLLFLEMMNEDESVKIEWNVIY